MDGEVAKQFQRLLEKQGFSFQLAHKVTKVEKAGEGVKATIKPAAGSAAKILDADVVLVAIGQHPFTQNLGLEAQGRGYGPRHGRRSTRTSPPTFRASTPSATSSVGPMLAHKAEDEGRRAGGDFSPARRGT